MLIRPTARAAPCQFTLNYDCGHAADSVMLRLGRDFGYTGVSVLALTSVIITGVFTIASILLFGARRPKREK